MVAVPAGWLTKRRAVALLVVLFLAVLVAFDLYRADQCRDQGCSAYNYLTFHCELFPCIR